MSDRDEEVKEVEEVTTSVSSEKKKITDAKNISKIYKIVAPLGLVVMYVFFARGLLPNASLGGLIAVWGAVYGYGAGTIDINLMLEKFAGMKK